ncbi:MAG: DoxX family protein [Gammaproteobacteria bacterium]|nr:DoxX family protein [Gammaproteobacteria bacterium]
MSFHITLPAKIVRPVLHLLNHLKDVGDLIARFWVAKIFLLSGLSKITDWDTTIVLFKDQYSVPFMNPVIAAYIGTFAEFFLPVVLVFGLGGRFFIFLFFLYNLFCAVSFHFLWTPAGASGLDDHITWGILLMMLMFHGSGRLSLDHLIHKRWGFLIHSGDKFNIY